MPDIFLHQKSAEDLINHFSDVFNSQAHQSALIIGTQGPDPYYYRLLSHGPSAMAIGNMMHDEHVGDLLETMAKHVKQSGSDFAHAFMAGFLAHVALDVVIHPYVYYHTGLYDENKPETHSARGLHLKFERRMDVQWMKSEGVDAKTYPLHTRALPLTRVPQSILSLLDDSVAGVYARHGAGWHYQKGYQSMRRIAKRIIKDPTGLKKYVYTFFDKLSPAYDMDLADLSYASAITHDHDYLDVNNQPWQHPLTGEMSEKSVPELYETAMSWAKEMINRLNDYILHDQPLPVNRPFGNHSLNTGCLVDDPRGMQYFRLYTE